MRRSLLALLAGTASLLASVHPAFAQTSVVTDPVGFTTTSLLGSSDTFVSIPFTRPPEFIGAIQSTSGSVITTSGTPGWTSNQFVYAAGTQPKHYYVLIGPSASTDPKEGHTYAVTANASNTLTVDTTHDDLTGIPANTQVTLIPYWTPATVFPASDANVSFTPTTSSSSYKTQIRVPDYTAPGINLPYSPVYFFSNNVDGTSNNVGWRRVGDNTTDHGDDTLLADGYFVVRNANGAPTLPLTNIGAVLLRKLSTALMTTMNSAQDNPVSILRPLDVTLNASGLNPGNGSGSFVANDQLLLFDNSQAAFDKVPSATYYYNTTAGNSGGWRLMGDNTIADRGNDLILAGTGFVVRKAATASGGTQFWTNSFPVSAVSAVSRKMHGTAGTFDINLPLAGASGIECRLGGPTQVVFTFPTAVTFNNAMITSGAGSVGGASGNGTTTVTVNLTGVTNQQGITLTLLGVNDGTNTNDVAIRIGVLLGDVNATRLVDGNDVSAVQAHTRQITNSTNFRLDVDTSGLIDGNDVSLVQSKTRTSIP